MSDQQCPTLKSLLKQTHGVGGSPTLRFLKIASGLQQTNLVMDLKYWPTYLITFWLPIQHSWNPIKSYGVCTSEGLRRLDY